MHSRSATGRRGRPAAHFVILAALLGAIVLVGSFPLRVTGIAPTPVLLAAKISLTGLAPAANAAAIPGELEAAPIPLTVTAATTVQDEFPAAADDTAITVRAIAERQENSAVETEIVQAARAPRLTMYYEHMVQPGENLTSIAATYRIERQYIEWNNAEVENPDVLQPGVILQIPTMPGIIHSTRYGETVSDIASRYAAEPSDIIEFEANGLLQDPNNLRADSLVFVPGGKILPRPAPALRPAPSEAPPVGGAGWGWPSTAKGTLTSLFGPSHPLGIDLAMPQGTPVVASRGGTVTFVGGNPCCSYGHHVIVDHGDGYETTYAHLRAADPYAVTYGDQVVPGQVIAYSGNTGTSTGPHLHFEIRRNNVPLDPLALLD